MQNFNSYQGYTYVMDPSGAHNLSQYPPAPTPSSINSYTYVNQSMNNVAAVPKPTFFINPHFGKKVFINPNFQAPGSLNQAGPQTLDGGNLGNPPESILSRHNVHVNPASLPKSSQTSKVHVNPANIFKTSSQRPNIHVNPAKTSQSLNVHVNPNCLLKTSVTQRPSVHVNPNILKLHNAEAHSKVKPNKVSGVIKLANNQKPVYQSATKIIRHHKEQKVSENVKNPDVPRKRRPSIRSLYKIVKSTAQEKWVNDLNRKTKTLIKSKYKLVKARSPSLVMKSQVVIIKKPKNLFKLDNRKPQENRLSHHKSKQFVYVNQFLSTTELARILPLKQKRDLSLINISGILYKKSHNSLQRSCPIKKNKKTGQNLQRKSILKSKYKLIRKSLVIKSPIRVSPRGSKMKVTKVWDIKPKVDPTGNGKLRKCNIPCPYYRKFGRCKGKDNGKCYRKHDPGQIALCTKFLQGACINEKCLLSHNVSAEKMPTCKFYLEGICSKDNCPYLHVKISPKADICRDFLEGYCKMATKCTKRHQLLCPDFEKHGSCQKQRCPYPHGRMVRKYSVFNKNKFAKKSSDNENPKNIVVSETAETCSKFIIAKNSDSNLNTRYYEKSTEMVPKGEASLVHSERTDFRSRPKLGELPSFIGFEES